MSQTQSSERRGPGAFMLILDQFESFRSLVAMVNEKRIARSSTRLYHALQNYPLQTVMNESAGRAVEQALVEGLEEHATSLVLEQLDYLNRLAASVPNKYQRVNLFRSLIPLMGEALAFRNGAWEVRKAVVELLCAVWGKDRIVHMLARIMRIDNNPAIPQTVAVELSSMANLESFDVLVDALDSKDDIVRSIVHETLEDPNHRNLALRTLERGLYSPKTLVRKRAADFLDKLDWTCSSNTLRSWHHVADQQWSSARALGAEAVPALENAMKGTGAQVRMQAALTLAELGWKPANPVSQGWFLVATQNWPAVMMSRVASRAALANVLEDEPSDVRAAAIATLEALGEDAVPALITVLQENSSVAAHRTACVILSRIAESPLRDDIDRVYAVLSEAASALMGVLQIPESPAIVDAANTLAVIAETTAAHPSGPELLQTIAAAIAATNRGLHAVYEESLDAARHRVLRSIDDRAASMRRRQTPQS